MGNTYKCSWLINTAGEASGSSPSLTVGGEADPTPPYDRVLEEWDSLDGIVGKHDVEWDGVLPCRTQTALVPSVHLARRL